ncbi:MAG TPA: transcriptional repressor AgaR [Blastocatellia bacterium]|nr:transcriptional repressor AgaR [Blastocatellia bacterium]
MLVEERRTAILNLLREHGKVRVKDLSRRFQTSEVTIRNDLKELHQRGLVHKAHGGAMPVATVSVEPSLQERFLSHAEEKRRIGAAAAALINDGETIILDSGSTTQEIARRLKGKQNLQVITNGVNIAMELVGVRGIQVILLGGVLRDNSFSIVGHFAEDMLDHLSADKLFIAADGCDLDFGLSTPNLEESRVNQAMVRIAREKIVVADSSKFGKTSLSRIASLSEMNKVITDEGLPEIFRAEIQARGLELILV